jgi:FkbM family methyltransferase
MTTVEVAARGLRFLVRPGTTDVQVVAEVVERRAYHRSGFLEAEPGDRWLDLGGNIGTFAVVAAAAGGLVRSFEPEPSNYALLEANVALNGYADRIVTTRAAVVAGAPGSRLLYLCAEGANKYRHTLTHIRGRRAVAVDCRRLLDLLDGWPNAVKLDIEGSELPMLAQPHGWPGIRKMVFEYHLDRDRRLARFHERMASLRAAGFEVHHPKMPEGKALCDWWPAAALVFARREG